MRTTIKAKVHLLATDNDNPTQVSIMRLPQKNKLYSHVAGGEFRRGLQMGHQPQHLYFTTDEEIKEGDFFISTNKNTESQGVIMKCAGVNAHNEVFTKKGQAGERGWHRSNVRKIVATTNPDLWIKKEKGKIQGSVHDFNFIDLSIPKIDIPFIEAYIKAYNECNPITKVLLEVGSITNTRNHTEKYQVEFLKIKPNGSVVVHPVKERMYTRAELKAALAKSYNDRTLAIAEEREFNLKEWFEENYPE